MHAHIPPLNFHFQAATRGSGLKQPSRAKRMHRPDDVRRELALAHQELAHQRAESRRKSARMDEVEALVAEAYKELEASLKREQSLREKLATNDRRWKEEVEALMQQLPIPNEQEEQEQVFSSSLEQQRQVRLSADPDDDAEVSGSVI